MSFLGLVSRMKEEIAEDLRQELSNTMKGVVRRSKVEYPMEVFRFTSLRITKYWCLARMRKMMGLAESTTHTVTVNEFLKLYPPIGMETSYIRELKYSFTRKTAISVTQPTSKDLENVRKM
jgi:hypothetical protein